MWKQATGYVNKRGNKISVELIQVPISTPMGEQIATLAQLNEESKLGLTAKVGLYPSLQEANEVLEFGAKRGDFRRVK